MARGIQFPRCTREPVLRRQQLRAQVSQQPVRRIPDRPAALLAYSVQGRQLHHIDYPNQPEPQAEPQRANLGGSRGCGIRGARGLSEDPDRELSRCDAEHGRCCFYSFQDVVQVLD